MGASAAIPIGMGISTLGNMWSADQQRDASQDYYNMLYPGNAQRLRDMLTGMATSSISGKPPTSGVGFNQLYAPEGATLSLLPGQNTPLTNAVESRYREVLSPEYRESALLGQSPTDVLGRLGEARRPVFESNLEDTLNAIDARYGPKGHRPGYSSDLYQIGAREGARAETEFESDLLGLFPDVQRNWTAATATLDNLISQAGAYGLSRDQLFQQLLLTLAMPPGGLAAGVPGASVSPMGVGLSTAGDMAMMYPILNSLMGQPSGQSAWSPESAGVA